MFLLSHSLERLREKRPGIHPRLQLIPFQHIYRGLEEGDLDAIAGFKETVAPGSAVYREIAKAPIMCVCSSRHPLSEKREAALEDLKNEPLVLFLPPRSSLTIAQLQGQLMGDRPPSEFYFCESAEMISLLVAAGYGISILPDLLIPENPFIARIPLKGAAPLSFGIYYKSLQGKPALRTFLQCVKECFPQSSNVKKPPSATSSA